MISVLTTEVSENKGGILNFISTFLDTHNHTAQNGGGTLIDFDYNAIPEIGKDEIVKAAHFDNYDTGPESIIQARKPMVSAVHIITLFGDFRSMTESSKLLQQICWTNRFCPFSPVANLLIPFSPVAKL